MCFVLLELYSQAFVPGVISMDVEWSRSAGGQEDHNDSIPPLSADTPVPAPLASEMVN